MPEPPASPAMHPVIKIVSFLVFTLAVAFGQARVLAAGALLLVILHALQPANYLRLGLRMLRRMRWFFLSLAVVYLLFTPGRLLFPGWPEGPTWEGVTGGAHRIASLVMIVLAVNLLLRTTPRPALISAILWCLTPLAWAGLPRERLALRIALTLDAIEQVQAIYRHRPRQGESDMEAAAEGLSERLKQRLWRIGTAAQRLVTTVIEQAEAAPLQRIEVPRPGSPPPVQWLYPLLLGALFAALGW